jgi:hypothetical protein
MRPSERLATEVTAPSGGSIHSTVMDMARWLALNLGDGQIGGRQLVTPEALRAIHAPQVIVGTDPSAPAPHAAYALGWFAYTYHGCECLSHGGYLHDIDSDIALFPRENIGLVCFCNFGFPTLAKTINRHIFDHLKGFTPEQSLEAKLAEYEGKVAQTQQRHASVHRVAGTAPSHCLEDYAGEYTHRGYGTLRIEKDQGQLIFRRNRLRIPLEHWHYDAWIPRDTGRFFIHIPHAFDRSSHFLFEADADGRITAVSIPLEPAVASIRFAKAKHEFP